MGTSNHFQIPYPEPTEPTRDGAVNMKAISDRVDAVLYAKGLTLATQSATAVVTTNASGDANVPFTVPFTAAPASVLAGPGGSGVAIAMCPYAGALIALNLFAIKAVFLTTGTPVSGGVRVNWIAQGPMTV